MPTGPNGEKRPTDVIANAVHVMKVATGEIEEEYVNAYFTSRMSIPRRGLVH